MKKLKLQFSIPKVLSEINVNYPLIKADQYGSLDLLFVNSIKSCFNNKLDCHLPLQLENWSVLRCDFTWDIPVNPKFLVYRMKQYSKIKIQNYTTVPYKNTIYFNSGSADYSTSNTVIKLYNKEKELLSNKSYDTALNPLGIEFMEDVFLNSTPTINGKSHIRFEVMFKRSKLYHLFGRIPNVEDVLDREFQLKIIHEYMNLLELNHSWLNIVEMKEYISSKNDRFNNNILKYVQKKYRHYELPSYITWKKVIKSLHDDNISTSIADYRSLEALPVPR